jgi:multiple sugar transport system permease protein
MRDNSISSLDERLDASGHRPFAQTISDFIERHIDVIYPAPSLLVLTALYLLPILLTVYLSFHSWSLSMTDLPSFVGLDNYVSLLKEPRFHVALRNTLYFVSLALVIQIPLGIGMGILFNREFVGRGIARTLFLFPMMAPPVAAMIGWRLMLNPNIGVLRLLAGLGVPPVALLASDKLLMPTFVLVDCRQCRLSHMRRR